MDEAEKLKWEKHQAAWLMKRVAVGLGFALLTYLGARHMFVTPELERFWQLRSGMSFEQMDRIFPDWDTYEPDPESLPDLRNEYRDPKKAAEFSGLLFVSSFYGSIAGDWKGRTKSKWTRIDIQKGKLVYESGQIDGLSIRHQLSKAIADNGEKDLRFFPHSPDEENGVSEHRSFHNFTGVLREMDIRELGDTIYFEIYLTNGKVEKTHWEWSTY